MVTIVDIAADVFKTTATTTQLLIDYSLPKNQNKEGQAWKWEKFSALMLLTGF